MALVLNNPLRLICFYTKKTKLNWNISRSRMTKDRDYFIFLSFFLVFHYQSHWYYSLKMISSSAKCNVLYFISAGILLICFFFLNHILGFHYYCHTDSFKVSYFYYHYFTPFLTRFFFFFFFFFTGFWVTASLLRSLWLFKYSRWF